MPTPQITDPAGDYHSETFPGKVVEYFLNASTDTDIPAGDAVSVNTAGNIIQAATDVGEELVLGVADELIAAETVGPVVVRGLRRNCNSQGAITAGAIVKRSATTAGHVAATATPAVGENIGVAIKTAASDLVDLYIFKS